MYGLTAIEDQRLLYHLTSIKNIGGILERGLKPRAKLRKFKDIADPEIIADRKALSLEKYVPFHWFAKNPFDGRVQLDQPGELFILISVYRSLAERENWKIIPCHPLASSDIELLDYAEGLDAIDWEAMNRRDYSDSSSKSVCMAECLSPRIVKPDEFSRIFVCDDKSAIRVERVKKKFGVNVDVTVNENMFVT